MKRRARYGADIDLTPLIDVLFMLIIFFVLATTFIQGHLKVELPEGKGETEKTESPILVTLTRDGAIFWGDEPVLSEDLSRLVEKSLGDKREILVAGDKEVFYGEIVNLLDMLQAAGLERLGLALQSAGKEP